MGIQYYEGNTQLARPAKKAMAVTKSDSVNFTWIAFGIYVGVTGDVVIVNPDTTVVTFKAVPAGAILPVECIRVNSTNTTATDMVALF